MSVYFQTSEDGSRRVSQSFRSEQLQLRLLRMDEKYRSHFLYDQIRAFEDKVYTCYEQFSTDMLYRMYIALTKRTVIDVRKVKTMAHLRKCFKDFNRTLRCKFRYRKVKATAEEERLVKYFTWYFQYFDYLKDLRGNFTDRIYQPLFRYFYHVGFDKPDREDTNDSGISTPSIVSFNSVDSGYSGISGVTTVLAEFDPAAGPQSARILSRSVSRVNSRADFEETQTARRNAVTKHALVLLSREYRDIRRLYDTSEIQKLARRMCQLKERTDSLLDREKSLAAHELLCQDSERSVFHLKIPELGSHSLMRLVPDILIKFQKQAWLARRWLELDDEKTKDLNAKLEKLSSLEENMKKRLNSLTEQITSKEKELESQADMLNKFLEREDRSNNLSNNMFDLRKRREIMAKKMEAAVKDRNDVCEKLNNAMRYNDNVVIRQYKPLYERNKLERFALERQIAALDYNMSVVEADMNIELEVKTEVIQTTNDVQDRCEDIELSIERAKKEQKAIQAALIPIVQDRKFVRQQLQLSKELPVNCEEVKPAPMKAEFIGSSNRNSERVVDLNSEYLGEFRNKNAVSVFLTGNPSEESGHMTPVDKPIKRLSVSDREGNRTFVPDLVPSEW